MASEGPELRTIGFDEQVEAILRTVGTVDATALREALEQARKAGLVLGSQPPHLARHRILRATRLSGARIGVPGFEPGTSATQRRRATRLRHTPRRPV